MPRPGRMTTERAKDFKGTLRQLLQTMSHYKLPLITAIVFAILSTIFNIAGPKVLAKATTALATGWIAKLRGTGSIDFGYIGKILLILLVMYLVSAAFSFCQSWIMSGLSQKMCYDFRRQISEKTKSTVGLIPFILAYVRISPSLDVILIRQASISS